MALIVSSLFFTSCGSSKKSNEETSEELAAEGIDEDEDLLFADDDEELPGSGKAEETAENLKEEGADLMDDVVEDSDEIAQSNPSSGMDEGNMGNYTVENGETLMWIAFKIYGDYSKWRSIANLNPGKLGPGGSVNPGTILKYYAPSSEFRWKPKGMPYLIRLGDTLGKISGNVYGTRAKWKHIWHNNRPMIKDPNLIFAGFTLYYLSKADLAYNN